MVKRLSPHTIVVYGSAPDKYFKKYNDMGINIVSFPSEVRDYYDRRKKDEQTR